MNARAAMERDGIVSDLSSISRELEQIADELRPLAGIGMEHCSSELRDLSEKYKKLRSKLISKL